MSFRESLVFAVRGPEPREGAGAGPSVGRCSGGGWSWGAGSSAGGCSAFCPACAPTEVPTSRQIAMHQPALLMATSPTINSLD